VTVIDDCYDTHLPGKPQRLNIWRPETDIYIGRLMADRKYPLDFEDLKTTRVADRKWLTAFIKFNGGQMLSATEERDLTTAIILGKRLPPVKEPPEPKKKVGVAQLSVMRNQPSLAGLPRVPVGVGKSNMPLAGHGCSRLDLGKIIKTNENSSLECEFDSDKRLRWKSKKN
jgi:hypothetical protein